MKVTMLIRQEALAQPRAAADIDKSQTRTVRDLPQCEAERVTRYYSDKWNPQEKQPNFQCSQRARYDIDGRKLCPRHAGEVALAHMLKERT